MPEHNTKTACGKVFAAYEYRRLRMIGIHALIDKCFEAKAPPTSNCPTCSNQFNGIDW